MSLASASHVSKPSFFKLPPEIRLMIYGHVFKNDMDDWLSKHQCGPFLNWKCILCDFTAKALSWEPWKFSHAVELKLEPATSCRKDCYHLLNIQHLHQYWLPPLLRLRSWRIGIEARLSFFSKHSLRFNLRWNYSMKDLARLNKVLRKLNLPDHRIIKHLALVFSEGLRLDASNRNCLDSFDGLVDWTLFMVRQKPKLLPEISAIQCFWTGATYPAPWSETNRLLSSWPKLLEGLQTLARQIREEHKLAAPARGLSRFPRRQAVEDRVRLWLHNLQHQERFVHARRDLLRSWAAVAKFEAMRKGWLTKHSKIRSPGGLQQWSQEKWDVYLRMPWSKPIRKSTEVSSVVELD